MMIKSPPLPFSSSSSSYSSNKTVVVVTTTLKPNLIISSSSSFFFLDKQKQKQTNPNNNYHHHHRTNKASSYLFGDPLIICRSHSKSVAVDPITTTTTAEDDENKIEEEYNNKYDEWRSEIGSPTTNTIITPPPPSNLGFLFSHHNQPSSSFLLLFAFFACTTCVAFTSFVIAAVPALHAMARAAISFSKLADTAREELPSTMAAIRLSSMEISDLTLELSDLSQEITKGVDGSAQVVQAAEAGIRQMGSRAHQQTMAMIEERANLPDLSLQPVVVGAAKKTSRAVGRVRKTLMNMFSKGDGSPDDENADAIERLEI